MPREADQDQLLNDDHLGQTAAAPNLDARKPPSSGLLAGSIANFGVQYNFTNTAIALLFLSEAHNGKGQWFTDDLWEGRASAILKSAAFVGSMIGMVIMGYLGDVIGRDPAFAVTSAIMVVFSIASGLAPHGSPNLAMVILLVCRFFLGVGIGGCYPLAASKGSEGCGSDSAVDKNQAVGVIFFWQCVGDLAPYIVGMALSFLPGAKMQFRLTLILGFLPPLAVFYLIQTHTHPRPARAKSYAPAGESGEAGEVTSVVAPGVGSIAGVGARASDSAIAASPAEGARKGLSSRPFVEQLRSGMRLPHAWEDLLATAVCWFFYDVAYYGSNQFTPALTRKVFGSDSDVFSDSWHGAVDMAVGLPATLHSIAALRFWGTKKVQTYGHASIAAASVLVAVAWAPLTAHGGGGGRAELLFAIYLVFYFAVNWGAKMGAFVLPQEVTLLSGPLSRRRRRRRRRCCCCCCF